MNRQMSITPIIASKVIYKELLKPNRAIHQPTLLASIPTVCMYVHTYISDIWCVHSK